MNAIIGTFQPYFIIIAIGLTIMASYTALDMFTLIKSSEKNKRLLFLGGTLSMGIGIWIMNFIGLISADTNRFASYHIPLTILSMAIGFAFTGMAFLSFYGKQIKYYHLIVGSVFLTFAVIAIQVIGLYAMNVNSKYNVLLLVFSGLLICGSFLFSLWILFSSKSYTQSNQVWLKPISAIIMSLAIIEGHFLLRRASFPTTKVLGGSSADSPFIIYLVLFVSVLIIGGLILSSTLISKQLMTTDTNLKDIKAALDASTIVAITNPVGTIIFVNDKFEEISKYKKDEIIGQNHRILNSGYHSKEFFKDLWRTIQAGQIWRGEIRNKAKDGTFYWVDTTIVPFLNKKGKPVQYIAIRSDISDRKKAEEHLKETIKENIDIKFALDQSSIVAFTDAKGMITSVNDKFCEISKYNREEILGKDHNILNSGYHSKDFFKNLWKTIGSGNVWKGEIRNKAKDGTYYWVDTTIVPFINGQGKPYQYLAIRNDITERKKTEEVLHRQDKLAAVGQLAAGVAHEIRNPLTSMKGYAEFLQLDEKDPERMEFLSIILDEIERVNTIVEDFMVLAKPKAVELEEKNVVPVIKNVVSLLEFEARKKNVRLTFDCHHENIQIECDENRLKQVFLNFIKNGIEAMPNGGELHVKTIIHDNNVQISIQDTGVGISKEKLKKLGEPFYTTKKNGNGLGLMVSFKIIESHNGKVFVESEPNKGTTFNILLPAKIA
ncbi:PAS domain S-box protein [Bacillus sp. ISL-40]|uniref:PAS domain-containing protein n=1 Tax=unclassified Bacillus (in: firmicutes) TaxID=185979 RepID=UPI001BE886FE|nr:MULTISPECIES: PAS domain-containing protein [unclassified Bacillus (in: firmicutes)]MBT2699216.1 PAS domain S-box protein [Bacillus sp. ISL-40]MBT2723517.1 PAS domain S-box protein [Bacillus sp. ISL-46]MBT2739588.1 PAS domain S-box protein [Bacillus sp. ISL-77]